MCQQAELWGGRRQAGKARLCLLMLAGSGCLKSYSLCSFLICVTEQCQVHFCCFLKSYFLCFPLHYIRRKIYNIKPCDLLFGKLTCRYFVEGSSKLLQGWFVENGLILLRSEEQFRKRASEFKCHFLWRSVWISCLFSGADLGSFTLWFLSTTEPYFWLRTSCASLLVENVDQDPILGGLPNYRLHFGRVERFDGRDGYSLSTQFLCLPHRSDVMITSCRSEISLYRWGSTPWSGRTPWLCCISLLFF